jgi:hypothetical protein
LASTWLAQFVGLLNTNKLNASEMLRQVIWFSLDCSNGNKTQLSFSRLARIGPD